MIPRRLVVTGCCYSLSLADALEALLPDSAVSSFAPWDLESAAGLEAAQQALAQTDCWVRMPIEADRQIESGERPDLVVSVPNLTFPAFHPDLVYAMTSENVFFRGICDYHSAIGLWAWKNGLSPEQASRLFTAPVMSALQYQNYWAPSVDALQEEFERCEVEFGPFWARLKRRGVFMHSVNHPRVDAVALLAKAVAVRLGAAASVWDDPVERNLSDHLAHIVWPVYPFVGDALGEVGSYRWRMNGHQFSSLTDWLTATWDVYGEQPKDEVLCSRLFDGTYDHVLGPYLDRVGDGA